MSSIIICREGYLALTLIYIAVGLALTTIAIEIAADYLKKLHYFGRKIENVSNVVIWFGGKRLVGWSCWFCSFLKKKFFFPNKKLCFLILFGDF